MKIALITFITMLFGLALGTWVMPAVAQTTHDQREALQDQASPCNDVIAANQPQEQISKWTEPASTTVTVTSTPLEAKSPRKQRWADDSGRPSKDDWTRCLQNEKCRPRNLYNNQWDRTFGPAYDFGN